jgi:hypothetical protein
MSEQADSPRGEAGPAQPSGSAGRDLSFLWPVIDRVRAVEIKFTTDEGRGDATAPPNAALEARIRVLEDEIAALRQSLQGTLGVLTDGVAAAAQEVSAAALELAPQRWWRIAMAAVLTVSLLLLSHWLIVFVYDRPTVLLRLVSIAIPLPLAVWLTLRHRIVPWFELLLGLAIGALAVFGMSYVTSVHEKTSFLPENLREWRETLEYIVSIMFAHFTGTLISSAIQARSGAQNRAGAATLKLAQVIAFVTGRAIASGPQLKKHVDSIQGLVNNLMPVASAVMAAVAGLKGVS